MIDFYHSPLAVRAIGAALEALNMLPDPIGHKVIALLAADFVEHDTQDAVALRCAAAARAWAACPCKETEDECHAASDAAYRTHKGAAHAALTAASDFRSHFLAVTAAEYSSRGRRAETAWQLTHIRTKHPLCEL